MHTAESDNAPKSSEPVTVDRNKVRKSRGCAIGYRPGSNDQPIRSACERQSQNRAVPMPAATGARALQPLQPLLSAKTVKAPSCTSGAGACRLPRVAVPRRLASTTVRTSSNSNSSSVLYLPPPRPRPHPHRRRHAAQRPCEAAVAITRPPINHSHGFHTSSSVLAPAAEPNPEGPPPLTDPNNGAGNGSGAAAGNGQPAETTAATDPDAKKEKLRSAGYGSARARANRNTRVEEAPVLELPDWFEALQISLYEQRPLGVSATLLPQLPEEDCEKILSVLESTFEKASLADADVQDWKDRLLRFAAGENCPGGLGPLVARVRLARKTAVLQTLLSAYHPDADPAHIEILRQIHAESGLKSPVLWPMPQLPVSSEARRWYTNLRSDVPPGSGLHLSPLAKRPDPEYLACVELLTAVQSQLTRPPTPGSSTQDTKRPPIVLSLLKGKSRSIADEVINNIATDLKADVVHLNAHHIARILGGHLGQNQYFSRGSLSMLGYAAAEMNGRLALRPDSDSEPPAGMVTVELPSRYRSLLVPRGGSASSLTDGRWEEMKIGTALETLVSAVDRKRAALVASGRRRNVQMAVRTSPGDLIIHLHDYVELSSLYPAIIHKLRAIADRMWMAGRRVVFVGSSSGDLGSPQWRDQLIDLGRDGALVIPFQASDAERNSLEEKWDTSEENLCNIEDMLRAMVGDKVPITLSREFLDSCGSTIPKAQHKTLFTQLTSHVYDAQWVSRLVSLMVGSSRDSQGRQSYGPKALNHAMQFMFDQNQHWRGIYPSIQPPYFSPLSVSRNPAALFASSQDDPSISNLSGAAASKEYNQDEKKLLSGLINAKDIHTAFADIIVPQETKESLIGLTTLSLIRPEAFSYGVLKTEHIPGCLLYGPPGTGKTLLAKAVAKESGASMLEVSAADINDKWVGQSEKNVQALFSLARKLAPCVIFLDEADALLAARRSGAGRAAHRETITQFLREWDGLTGSRAFIMVATNRPFDLDEAVLRRLPRKILVDLPLAAEREAILRVMLKQEILAPDVDLVRLSGAETELYSGSDLKNLCVSAAMEAVREEVRAKEAWTGEGEYQYPEKRVLELRHFEKGLREISASISGDMESLKAIRKFDEQYGDAGRKRKVRRGMGFEVVPDAKGGTEEARVRQVGIAA